jgi:hypothetical protein
MQASWAHRAIFKNKNNANVYSICFDSCYMLTKGVNSVKAKFIGTTNCGLKEESYLGTKDLSN